MKREWGTRRAHLRRRALLGPLVVLLGLSLAVGPGPAAPSATAGPAPAPRATAGTTAYKVVTHNVLRKRSAVDTAIAQAVRYGAQAIFLQELCLDDYRALQQAYGGRWTLSFQPKGIHTGGGVRVCQGEQDPDEELPDGVATIWTGGSGGVARRFLFRAQDSAHQDDSTGLACVFYDRARVRLCSVHSVYGDPVVRRAQHEEIRDLTTPWVKGGKLVVLGGDFNTIPTGKAMRPVYAAGSSAGGRFREVSRARGVDCRCGSPTIGGAGEDNVKFDYVFFSNNAMAVDARRSAYALPADFTESDHRMLRGYANVSLPR